MKKANQLKEKSIKKIHRNQRLNCSHTQNSHINTEPKGIYICKDLAQTFAGPCTCSFSLCENRRFAQFIHRRCSFSVLHDSYTLCLLVLRVPWVLRGGNWWRYPLQNCALPYFSLWTMSGFLDLFFFFCCRRKLLWLCLNKALNLHV